MIHATYLWSQNYTDSKVSVEELDQFAEDDEVIELCKQYRETNDDNIKRKLKVLMASGIHFWMDIDGANHKGGNAEVDIELVTSLIPHVAWFISPSGLGMKILVEINREPSSPEERKAIAGYLVEAIGKTTGHIIDKCRTDIAFVSDYHVTFSDGIFNVPDHFDTTKSGKCLSRNNKVVFPTLKSDRLSELAEIMDYFPYQTDYNMWLALVMAVLSVYGERAIPLLESKWESNVPYETLLKYSEGADTTILEVMWTNRTRKNAPLSSRPYKRRVVTGATGAGKSLFAINEMKTSMPEYDDEYGNYFIYVVSSVEQAIDFAKKLEREKLSNEILVSDTTYESLPSAKKLMVRTNSTNNKAVKIIQLALLKRNGHLKYISDDNRKLCTMYIDELTATDFIRPSISSTNIIKAYTGIKSAGDMVTYYLNNFSEPDFLYSQVLSSLNDDSHFISSMLYQDVDTTVLTAEELTTICCETLGFNKITIREEETKGLLDTCTLHVADSSYFVMQYAKSESLKNTILDMEFDNIFANKCDFATGNLMTIKGQHLTGKNLSIIRHLPKEFTSALKELIAGCFKTLELDPVSIYYKDVLLQAVGRSIGFRGETEAWVMVHSSIWKMIEDTTWTYNICMWNVEIDEELKNQIDDDRIRSKELFKDRNEEQKKWKRQNKEARIKQNYVVTGNPRDILYSYDIKSNLGDGITLNNVSQALNVQQSRNKKSRYIEGVRKVN